MDALLAGNEAGREWADLGGGERGFEKIQLGGNEDCRRGKAKGQIPGLHQWLQKGSKKLTSAIWTET